MSREAERASSMPDTPALLCPCGRQDAKGRPFSYAQCCGPCHAGAMTAPDAERLMRSRYSAFVRQDATYLLRTWHASTRPASLDLDPSAKWLGLAVKHHHAQGSTAQVHFVARYRVAGRAVRQSETSRFVLEDGQWYYVDGDEA
jgi:SEC-C motif domain protein